MRPFEHLLQRRQLCRAEGGAVTSRFPRMPCGEVVGVVINMAAATNVGAATATADIDACNGKIIMNALKTENLVSLFLPLSKCDSWNCSNFIVNNR